MSWESSIMDTDYHPIYDIITHEQVNEDKPIIIGDHVWVCTRVTILKGSNISDNIVLAAGSIVTSKLNESNSIYSGNRILKRNVNWGKGCFEKS